MGCLSLVQKGGAYSLGPSLVPRTEIIFELSSTPVSIANITISCAQIRRENTYNTIHAIGILYSVNSITNVFSKQKFPVLSLHLATVRMYRAFTTRHEMSVDTDLDIRDGQMFKNSI